MEKNGKKVGLLVILICLCGLLVVVISIYAGKRTQTEDSIDAVSGSVYMESDGSSEDENRVLNETPVEPGSDIGTAGDGTDTVGDSFYIDPEELDEEGVHSLSESPLDE